jgi:hypothetical protein
MVHNPAGVARRTLVRTIHRPVITVDLNAHMLRQGTFAIHEALLDGDESFAIGAKVLVHDGDITYVSATVTAHDGNLWEVTLRPDDEQ